MLFRKHRRLTFNQAVILQLYCGVQLGVKDSVAREHAIKALERSGSPKLIQHAMALRAGMVSYRTKETSLRVRQAINADLLEITFRPGWWARFKEKMK